MIVNASFEYGLLVFHVDKNKLWFAEHRKIHILHFKVCFVSAVCVCVREKEKGKRDSEAET